MSSKSVVELADRKSRLRAVLFATAALMFVLVQVITRPSFDPVSSTGWRLYAWAVNAVFLMLCLGTGGFLGNKREVRALMNDELAGLHYQRACTWGFWVALVAGLAVFNVPSLRGLSGQQASYLVVTPSLSIAVLLFSWWEYRSHAA